MNLRWLWFDHIPTELKLSPGERRRVAHMATEHQKRDPKYRRSRVLRWQIALPAALVSGAIAVVAIVTWQPIPLSFILPFGFWGLTVTTYANHRSRRPFIRKALNDLGYPICIDCGYILHGAPGRFCPECGAEREPMPPRSVA